MDLCGSVLVESVAVTVVVAVVERGAVTFSRMAEVIRVYECSLVKIFFVPGRTRSPELVYFNFLSLI